MSLRVYLAGPEVFLPDARAQLDRKITLTRAAGLVPVAPGDVAIAEMPDHHARALEISRIDEELMLSADAIIANLTPFRGVGADPGTCYELGFMCARGKATYAYTNVADNHFLRISTYYGRRLLPDANGRRRGPDGLAAEDYSMIDNLMLHAGIERRGGAIVVGDAPPEAIYTDLAAFERVLAMAAKALLG
jgi:nucleoside 2-deoxyribosyltransferase